MNIGELRNLKFSIWDLAVLTTIIAVLFSLPVPVVGPLVAISMFVVITVPFLLVFALFSNKQRKDRRAVTERLFIKVLVRVFLASLAIAVIGSVAAELKTMNLR